MQDRDTALTRAINLRGAPEKKTMCDITFLRYIPSVTPKVIGNPIGGGGRKLYIISVFMRSTSTTSERIKMQSTYRKRPIILEKEQCVQTYGPPGGPSKKLFTLFVNCSVGIKRDSGWTDSAAFSAYVR